MTGAFKQSKEMQKIVTKNSRIKQSEVLPPLVKVEADEVDIMCFADGVHVPRLGE